MNGTTGGLQYTRLYMNDSTSDHKRGRDRIGVFNCVVENEGVVTNITTITMETEAWIFPVTVTKTVNARESPTLDVTASFGHEDLRWRRGGSPSLLPGSSGKTSIKFDNVNVADAGIYECHRHAVRNGSSAFMKLIVRTCPAGMWGDSCDQYCTSCYNGGVCDDVSGQCICAPGFSGKHCELLQGSNRWGQQAEWQCSDTQGNHSEACRGRLMCLQDPFGCACAAGFKGLACDESCDTQSTGKFGKNCEQTCHCADGKDACLWDTGDCNNGCENGWKGTNCQVPDPCPKGFGGDFCDRCPEPGPVGNLTATTVLSNETTLSWTPPSSNPCPINGYYIEYELINKDMCKEIDNHQNFSYSIVTSTNATIEGLEPYSEYNIYVIATNDAGNGTASVEYVETDESVPDEPINGIELLEQEVNALYFRWNDIPCGNRRGNIITYHYELYDIDDVKVLNGTILDPEREVNLTDLTPCSTYRFYVAASTAQGRGPFGEYFPANTSIAEPGPVDNLTSTTVLSNETTLSWTPPTWNACPINGYYIEYELINEDMCKEIDNPQNVSYSIVTSTSATIEGLEPYSEYNIYVIATNDAGNGTASVEYVETDESVPDEPIRGIELLEQEVNALSFRWNEIPCGNRRGNIISYHYELYDIDDVKVLDGIILDPERQVNLTDLTPCSTYRFHVAASTAQGRGPSGEYFPANTSIAVPKAVEELTLSTDNVGALNATWEKALDDPCPIDNYYYQIQILNLGQCYEYTPPEIITKDFTTGTALLITNLDSYSTYRIYVNGENNAGNGTVRNATSTTVETLPDAAPYEVSGTVVDSRTLRYTWEQIPCGLRGGEITKYHYQLQNDTGIIIEDGFTPISITAVSFFDLTPCATYIFHVSATTALGDGPFTDDLYNVTATEVPEGVEGLTVVTTGVDSLNVSWKEPSIKPCPIEAYHYRYELIYLDQCQPVDPPKLIADGTTRNTFVAIADLETHSTYQIYINGRNEAGDGGIQNKTATTGSSAPAVAPVITSADTVDEYTLSFSWDPIPCGKRGGMITGYYYRLESEDNIPHEGLVNETTTTLTLSQLIPCTQYTFTILAINENGYGPNNETGLTTDISEPDIVEHLLVSQGSSATELDVSWSKPMTTPCPVDKYSVEYQLLNRDQCQEDNLPDRELYGEINTTSVTVDNLIPNSKYEVFIIAINEVGSSEETSMIQDTSEVEPRRAPANVTNNIRTNDTLTFTWDEIECGYRGGVILSYNYNLSDNVGNLVEEGNATDSMITEVYIDELDACIQYTFIIAAVTSAGIGKFSSPLAAETDFAVPGSVQSPNAMATSSPNELLITWRKQTLNECPTSLYEIEYELINQDQCEQITDPIREFSDDVTTTNTTLESLIPYSTYRVYIAAVNQAGLGQSVFIEETTYQTAPSASPVDIIYEATTESLAISWQQPPCGNRGGVIVNYQYTVTDVSNDIIERNDTVETSIDVVNLVPCGLYQFSVNAKTITGEGPESEIILMETDGVEPGEPTGLIISDKTETTVLLSWNEPANQPCQINQYQVVWQAIEKPYDDDFVGDEPPEVVYTSSTFYTVEPLEPSTKYRFEVSAFNDKYPTAGPAVSIESYTDPWQSLPTDEPLPEIVDRPTGKTAKTVTIQLPEVPATYIYVNKYQIGVAPLGGSNSKRDVSTPDFGNCGDINYIAGEVNKSSEEFIVGTGETFLNGLYCNGQLNSKKTYEIYIGFASRLNGEEVGVVWPYEPIRATPLNKCPIWCWLGPVMVALVLAIIVVIGVLYTKSRKVKSKENVPKVNHGFNNIEIELRTEKKEVSTKPSVAPKPKAATNRNQATDAKPPKRPRIAAVQVDHLFDYVYKKKANSVKWAFDDHYQLLPDGQMYPCTVAQHEKNKQKNRYANIIPYDHSRVVLEKIDGDPYSDYINANYIDGYLQPKKYIATQGPNVASIPDFWRMVWQEDVRVIVMVTKCEEGGKVKCAHYWPEQLQKGEVAHDIVVTMVSEDVHRDFTIRHFELNKMFDNRVRPVRHYHFTSWPDMGTPDQATPLLNFIKLIKSATEGVGQTTIVVHCSAGVGRTGTFIALDSLLEQAEQEHKIDVFQFTVNMRQNRLKMVQTIAQYDFIYDALVEATMCGNTSITANDFHSEYTKLKVRNQRSNRTGIEAEYEKLQQMSRPPRGGACRGGMDPVNVKKNRFPNVLPVDRSRPYLMTGGADNSTNYINAAFIDGYDVKDMFLATQMPLPNTVGDIWRMVYDYNSYTIVMLNPIDTSDQWLMARYWPEDDIAYHGPLTIQFVSVTEIAHGIFFRTFKLSNRDNPREAGRIIRQYEYPGWPLGQDVPVDTESILNLINAVDQWQKEKPNIGKPLTVHCIDGVAVSTTYCALTSIIERLKTDEVVDVFQTVKRLRMNRYGAVSSLGQYIFLYDAVLDYISSYSIYENF